mgnify:CR=1 FL=1
MKGYKMRMYFKVFWSNWFMEIGLTLYKTISGKICRVKPFCSVFRASERI